eukprot:symbB.v1.2.034880.t1/scaffold4581.1/size37751/4
MATSKGSIEPIVYPVPEFFNTQEAPRAAHAEVGLTFAALPSWGAFLPRHVAPPAPSECSTTDTEHLQRVQKPWSVASMTLVNVFSNLMDAALSCHRPGAIVPPARRSFGVHGPGLGEVKVIQAN